MKKQFLILLLVVFTTHLHAQDNFQLDGRFKLDLELKASRFIDCFIEKLEKEKNVKLTTQNAVIQGDKITSVRLEFESYEHADVDSAREMLLVILNSFVAAVNNDKKLQPFLAYTPFSVNNVDIRIRYRNRECDPKNYPYIGNISAVGAYDGRLVYHTINSYNFQVEVYRTETISQAEFILRTQAY